MNAPPTREAVVAPVDLGRTEDFALGFARVRPSAREIDIGGRVERLQPRVMQVLVALARAQGAVVSRDDLIEACWGGLAVSEDAINRVVSKLRRLAELEPEGFAIETVSKVGYRLTAATPAGSDAPPRDAVASQGRLTLRFLRWRRAHAIAAAATIALSAAVAGLALWRGAQPALYSIERAELIVHSALKEEDPALSPNGRYILYIATPTNEPGATADLYMQAVAGGEPMRLTNTPLDDEMAPAWSPEGDWIAYARSAPLWREASPCRIYVRAAPLGEERPVGGCASARWTRRLAWDPSGQKLLFSDGPPRLNETYQFQWRIRELDIQTGKTQERFFERLPIRGHTNATFSPDGKRIAFVRYGGTFNADLGIYDRGPRRLQRVGLGGATAYIAWAPDSRSLFAASDRFGAFDLWQVRADGRGAPARVGLGPGDVLRLSSAGDLLAFGHVSRQSNLTRLSETGRETPITTGNQEDLQPAYSSTGVLAFFRLRAGWSVYIQEPDQPPRWLVRRDDLRGPRGLRWSPDGRWLAFVATRNEGAHLYVLDRESGRSRELATPGLEPWKPDWSLDGRSLVFFAGGARGLRLWRLPIREGARPQEIAGHNLANAFPLSEVRVLQEGLFVASEFERNGVFRLDGSRAPVLLTTETHARGFIPAWNVIRGRLYYIFAEDPQTQRLYWRPAGGGSRTHVADIGRSVDPIGSLDVDPRTGDFVYSTIISEEYDIGLARLRQSGGSWSQK